MGIGTHISWILLLCKLRLHAVSPRVTCPLQEGIINIIMLHPLRIARLSANYDNWAISCCITFWHLHKIICGSAEIFRHRMRFELTLPLLRWRSSLLSRRATMLRSAVAVLACWAVTALLPGILCRSIRALSSPAVSMRMRIAGPSTAMIAMAVLLPTFASTTVLFLPCMSVTPACAVLVVFVPVTGPVCWTAVPTMPMVPAARFTSAMLSVVPVMSTSRISAAALTRPGTRLPHVRRSCSLVLCSVPLLPTIRQVQLKDVQPALGCAQGLHRMLAAGQFLRCMRAQGMCIVYHG